MKKKQIKQLTIDTKRWARGGKKGDCRLLNSKGNMCCLGFLGKACGVKKEFLQDVEMPDHINVYYDEYDKYPTIKPNDNCIHWDKFAEINDSDDISDKERKETLKEMFKKYLDIKLFFK